jgi:glucose 1-dehydrogenase
VLDVSLKSAFYRTQPSAKQLMAQGDGDRIIKVTSMHEDWPIPGNTADCHWKCGMRMCTRTAGVELAPHSVLVVGVGPGAVETPVNTATMNDPGALKRLDVALPIGRMAKPSEIGSEVVILASPGASYMTATTVFAGGAIMQSTPGW